METSHPAALKDLEELLAQHPRSDSAPEALHLQGVAKYKHTQSPQPLKAAYEALAAEYPDSVWVKRAYPYRLL